MMNNKPKVFHLITRLLKGGAEAKTITEIVGLHNQYEFSLGHGAAFDPEQVQKMQQLSVPTYPFSLVRHYNIFSLSAACYQVYRHLRKHPVDIVHTHSTEAGIVGRIAARMARVPLIIHTIHGVPFTEQRNWLLRHFLRAMEQITARWTTRLISNADVITQTFLKANVGRPDQYVTILSGVDLEKFAQTPPAELSLPKDTIIVLTAARLVSGKGLPELLQAAECLREEISNIVFLIAGDGPLAPWLKQEIQQNRLDPQVRVLGHQSDLAPWMRGADLFVLPSYREGTPRVISEAMAAGLPIIATRIDGIPEQVEDGVNGILVDPRTVKPLIEALKTLAQNADLRRSMGQASLVRAQAFSQEKMLETLDELYQSLLAQYGGVCTRTREAEQ